MRFQRAVFLIGLLLLGSGMYSAVPPASRIAGYMWRQSRTREDWREWMRGDRGNVAGWLRSEAVGLCVPVTDVESGKPDLENFAAGFGVADAGEGMVIIFAHRDRHFSVLRGMKTGTEMLLDVADGVTRRYVVVDSEVIDPDDVWERLRGRDGDRWLVLATCHPFTQLGPAPNRLLVWAWPDQDGTGENGG
ncbi:MAG: sortase [Lentisphaerae bacterium]|nr:sortase [Lentisphaerota bacterium]